MGLHEGGVSEGALSMCYAGRGAGQGLLDADIPALLESLVLHCSFPHTQHDPARAIP